MGNIAFVGSTIPASAVKRLVESGKIGTVYTSSPSLLKSYNNLKKCNKKLTVKSLSDKIYFQFITTIIILIYCKICSRKVWFFHEACWGSLDFNLWLIQPNGYFCRIEKIVGFEEVSKQETVEYLKTRRLGVIFFRIYSKIFRVHKQVDGNGEDYLWVLVAKEYPRSIKVISGIAEFCFQAKNDLIPLEKTGKRIIFLVGTDAVNTNYLKRTYCELILIAINSGWVVAVKDHPNEEMRINLTINEVIVIDPSVPAELIHDEYRWAVGVASFSMARYGCRALSILNLLDEMKLEAKIARTRYINTVNENAVFLSDVSHFCRILAEE